MAAAREIISSEINAYMTADFVEGCYIESDAESLAAEIKRAAKRIDGTSVNKLSEDKIAHKIMRVYKSVIRTVK